MEEPETSAGPSIHLALCENGDYARAEELAAEAAREFDEIGAPGIET